MKVRVLIVTGLLNTLLGCALPNTADIKKTNEHSLATNDDVKTLNQNGDFQIQRWGYWAWDLSDGGQCIASGYASKLYSWRTPAIEFDGWNFRGFGDLYVAFYVANGSRYSVYSNRGRNLQHRRDGNRVIVNVGSFGDESEPSVYVYPQCGRN